jgi:preprotein translocase subunit SecE
MARNRKRAKERRDRRPQPVSSRSRVAAARGDTGGGLPSPIEHAAPDVELANAQLELARVEAGTDSEPQSDAELYEPELTDGELAAAADAPSAEPPGDGGAVAVPGPVSEARPRPRARLAGFLEGSWRELQRVQWPDRRQVMQATAVVIGFVIVAGIWLGVADTLASHLMNYVLTGAKSALAWVAIAVIVLSVAGWAFLADRHR